MNWQGLTDEDRQAVFESLPDMLEGFLKTWGWLHFAKAIEAKSREKNTRAPLSDEQIHRIADIGSMPLNPEGCLYKFARAIEAAHGISAKEAA